MKWLIGLLVLLALVGVGDRVAEHVAEGVLADQLAQELGTRPSVEVRGWPFLPQALRGRYRELDVRAPRVQQGTIAATDVRVELVGVRVPLSDAVGGRVTAVPVDRLDLAAVLSYDDLESAAGTQLQLSAAPDGVRVSGTVRVLGQDLDASAVSTLRLDQDDLVVTAQQVAVGGVAPTGAVARALAGRLDLRVPLADLPYGVRLDSVASGPDGIAVTGSARDQVLQR